MRVGLGHAMAGYAGERRWNRAIIDSARLALAVVTRRAEDAVLTFSPIDRGLVECQVTAAIEAGAITR